MKLNQPSTLVISIKESRKLLGKDAEQFSDNQIEQLILDLVSLGHDELMDTVER